LVKRTGLDHGVPLPVGWRRQDGARLQGKLGHVFGVFGHRRPYVSVLFVEELGVGGSALGALRRRGVGRFGRQAVLPVFRIVKGHLQLLPADFARHQSVLEHAGVVRVGVDLVGRQAAVPEGGRSGEGTGLAHLGLAGRSRLALAGGDAGWIDGVVAVEGVGWRAVVTRHARWRGLASGEGVVGQAGLDGKREVGPYRRDG